MTICFPWPQFQKPLSLDIEITAPGVPTENIDAELRRIRLDNIDGWDTVSLKLEMASTEVPADGIGELSGYVLVSSTRTNTRTPVKLELAADSITFGGDVSIDKGLLAGAVHVQGQVVATGDWGVRTVGVSEEWILVVDESAAPIPPGAPPFDIVWVDFAGPEASSLLKGAAETSYALMDTSVGKPVLYLNKHFKGLDYILMANRPRDERKRLRNVLGAQISHYAVSTLFDEAIRQCDETQGVITLPDDQLLARVITAVADGIDADDPDELVTALMSDGGDRDATRARVDDAISVMTNLSSFVSESVRAVANV